MMIRGLARLCMLVSLSATLLLAGCGGGADHKGTEVAVTGQAPSGQVASGADAVFTMRVSNVGGSTANTLQIVNLTGGQLALVGITCSASGGAECPAAPSALMTIPTLPAGGVLTFLVTARVLTGAVGAIVNTMTVSTADDIDKSNNSVSASGTAFSASSNLVVTGVGPGGSVTGGGQANFVMSVLNAGPDVAGAFRILNTAGNNLTLTGITCAATGGAVCPTVGVVMDVASMPANGMLTFTIATTVAAGVNGTVANTLGVTADVDADRTDNQATATATVVTPRAGLFVTGTGPAATVSGGATASFTMTVGNAGPDVATSVRLVDTVGSNLTFQSATCLAEFGAVCPTALGPVMVFDSMAAGGKLTFTINAAVAPGTNGAITNTLAATAANDADRTDNNATAVGTAATSRATLALTGTAPAGTVAGGDVAHFLMTLGNSGPDAATAVRVTQTVSGNLSFVGATCVATLGAICPASVGVVTDVGALPVGGLLSFDVSALVSPGANGAITNTMQATAGNDNNPSGNSAVAVGRAFTARSDITVAGTGPTNVPSGEAAIFRMMLSNATGSAAPIALRLINVVGGNLTLTSIRCVTESGGARCPAVAPDPAVPVIDVATLPGGGSLEFEVATTVTRGTNGAIINTMTAFVTSGISSEVTGLATGNAYSHSLATSVVDAPVGQTVTIGSIAAFTVQVRNSGPAPAVGVVIKNVLSAGLQLQPNGLSCQAQGGAVCPAQPASDMTVAQIPSGGVLKFLVNALVVSAPFNIETESISATALGDARLDDNTASSVVLARP